MRPISGTGSIAFDDVVPTLAQKRKTESDRLGGHFRFGAPVPASEWQNFRPLQSGVDSLFQFRRSGRPSLAMNEPELKCRPPAFHRIHEHCWRNSSPVRGPLAKRRAKRWRPCPELRLHRYSSKEIFVAGRACGPASPVRASPVPCTPGWWPTTSPAHRGRKKAGRRELQARKRSKERKQRNLATANA